MDKQDIHEKPEAHNDGVGEYRDMEILEILEGIREDMEEFGLTTLAEVIQRIDVLHEKLDK